MEPDEEKKPIKSESQDTHHELSRSELASVLEDMANELKQARTDAQEAQNKTRIEAADHDSTKTKLAEVEKKLAELREQYDHTEQLYKCSEEREEELRHEVNELGMLRARHERELREKEAELKKKNTEMAELEAECVDHEVEMSRLRVALESTQAKGRKA